MLTAEQSKALAQFEAGQTINEIWLTPMCPLDRTEIEDLIRAEMKRLKAERDAQGDPHASAV